MDIPPHIFTKCFLFYFRKLSLSVHTCIKKLLCSSISENYFENQNLKI